VENFYTNFQMFPKYFFAFTRLYKHASECLYVHQVGSIKYYLYRARLIITFIVVHDDQFQTMHFIQPVEWVFYMSEDTKVSLFEPYPNNVSSNVALIFLYYVSV